MTGLKNRLGLFLTASAMLIGMAGKAQNADTMNKNLGVLLIKGPENPKSQHDIKFSYGEIAAFNQSFSHYPHQVIGGPEKNLDIGEVEKLVAEYSNRYPNVLIFVGPHGDRLQPEKQLTIAQFAQQHQLMIKKYAPVSYTSSKNDDVYWERQSRRNGTGNYFGSIHKNDQ